MLENNYKSLIAYVLKFAFYFCLLYFGTLGIIGLSTREGYYSPTVAKYFDFISLLRSSYLHTCKAVLSLFNYQTTLTDKYTLMGMHGGIRMVYTCIGYGVMSFWASFIISNISTWKRKILWVLGGLFSLWCINLLRICLLIIALDKHWPMPLGLDHHTWFNIAAYLLIFIMIYFYDKSSSKSFLKSTTPKHI